MIGLIEGTFYCIDPATEEPTCEIKFHIDEVHCEQYDASRITMLKENTYDLLTRIQEVVRQFNYENKPLREDES